ncbi:hypothetical protein BDZ97DRAFT_1806077 [Flammula alnicola]|nr:hypothetical protein BDZ97DRAFT_1806077 [Flammula alnicola]
MQHPLQPDKESGRDNRPTADKCEHRQDPLQTTNRPLPLEFLSQPGAEDVLRRSPPQNITPDGLDRSAGRNQQPICKARPAYNDGHRAFPTCGNTCASKLQAATNLPNPIHGRMGNPYRNGGENSRHSFEMCCVCQVRPRCERGGKIYPTCGLTCAAKMHPAGSVEKCDFCKQRPKVVINNKVFPHCGRTCRDKAKAAAAAAASSATCTTCLVCWKATRTAETDDFCSQTCHDVAERRAPFLLEVPRGHAAFKKVADYFASSWRNPKKNSPPIKRIYMVNLKPASDAAYERYKNRLGSRPLYKKKGNEKRDWLGITRECGFGDTGNMEPCSSAKCLLCSLMKSSVSRNNFPEGITSTSLLESKRRSSKVVLLAHVLHGQETDVSIHEPRVLPRGSDSIRLVEYRTFRGTVDYHGESVVFDGDAVKPLYLISYE